METYTILKDKNTGVIIDIRSTDYVKGGESAIRATVLEPTGQYDNYLPDEEAQARWAADDSLILDTSACVTFSALNCLETIFIYKLARGLFSATQVKFLTDEGYIDHATGKVNFSDRYTAKMSGTTKNGNSLGAVGDSIRSLHGLIPEKDWLWPDTSDIQGIANYDKRFARYYADVPTELVAKGKRFLDHFSISYQWILVGTQNTPLLKAALPNGVIQIASAICMPWNSNDGMPPVPACGCTTQHATIIYGYRDDGALKDFDHYKSFRKLLAPDYCIQYAMQYYVEEVSIPQPPQNVIGYRYDTNLRYGDPDNTDVRMLQAGLQYLKDKTNTSYLKPGVFGPFGPQTRTALDKFQRDNGIVDPQPGQNFGPKSRAAMTKKVAI